MSKNKDKYNDDDGRVIAPMNVEGMPWYVKKDSSSSGTNKEPLNKSETRGIIFSALLAALVIGGVFVVAVFLFIMFSIHVWLR